MPKRFIEDVLPLGELNKYAQKGGGIGSLNAMHPHAVTEPVGARLVDLLSWIPIQMFGQKKKGALK